MANNSWSVLARSCRGKDGGHEFLRAAVDQADLRRVAGETGRVVDVEAVHHALPVFLDGLNGELQDMGDHLVRIAFGDELQHLDFARRETSHDPAGSNDGVAQNNAGIVWNNGCIAGSNAAIGSDHRQHWSK